MEIFALLHKYDKSFIKRYLKENYEEYGFITKKQLSDSNLSELWAHCSDTEYVYGVILEHFKNREYGSGNYSSNIAGIFKEGDNKGLDFLLGKLKITDEPKMIVLLYNIVVTVYNAEKFRAMDIILAKRNDIGLFRMLPLHLRHHYAISTGDTVARLQNNIRLIEAVKNFIQTKGLDYLEHIEYLEEEIETHHYLIDLDHAKKFKEKWGI